MVDVAANRILDYVNLSSTEPTIDLADQLRLNSDGTSPPCDRFDGMASLFCTNRLANANNTAVMTYGILNQIMTSRVHPTRETLFGLVTMPPLETNKLKWDKFRRRIQGAEMVTTDFAAPFTPMRTVHHNVSWQVKRPARALHGLRI